MVSVGVAPRTGPVSDGAMGVSAAGAGITMGSRFGGATGWCAQAASNRAVQPRKNCRLFGVMSIPLAELILPGAQHAEYVGGLREHLSRMRLGGRAHASFVATQKRIHSDLQTQG